MLSRTIRRSVLDTRWSASLIPPTFLLPSRARYFNSTAPIVDGDAVPETPHSTQSKARPSLLKSQISASSGKPNSSSPSSGPSETTSDSPGATAPLHPSIKELLPLLRAQPSHYITIHIHARPYLVTVGDVLHLPFNMPGVVPGDILRFNRASVLGSRDYTLKGALYVDERLFECRARVMGIESEPMRIKEKTKRRQRRVKKVKSKHRFTVLRVAELKVKALEEIIDES
ncbi:MAG: hypothetical protein M1837_002704 [Sclerophora amabilis]|nr:MAG: hypothetical protein M1837_002704 [Sclerophora amabilis]